MSDLDQNIVGTVGGVVADSHNEYDVRNISEQEAQTTMYADLKEVGLVVDPVVLLHDVNLMDNFADKTNSSLVIQDSRIYTVDKESNKPLFRELSPTQDKELDSNGSSQDFLNFLYNTYVSVNEFLKQHDPFPNFLVIPGVAAQRGAARAPASTSATQNRGSSNRDRPSFGSTSLPTAANDNMPPVANSNFRAPVFPGDAPPIRFSTQGTTPSTFPTSTSSTAYYPTSGTGMARQFHEPASIFSQTNYPSFQTPGFSFSTNNHFSSSSSLSSYPSSSSFPSYSITATLPTPSFSSYSPLSSFSSSGLGSPLSVPSFRLVEISPPLSFIDTSYLFPPRQEEEMPGFFHGVTLGPPEALQIQGLTPEESSHWREWKAARYKFYMQSIQRALKHTYKILFRNNIPIDEEYIRMVLKKVDLATIESALESGFVFETMFMRSPLYEQFKAKRAAAREKAAKLENVAGSGGGNWNNGTGTDFGSKWFQWFNTVDEDFDPRTCLYKESPAHSGGNKHKSRVPTDGQKNLPNSYRFSESGRVSVDLDNVEIIIYRREQPNVYHGYVVTPEVLRSRETGAYALLRKLDMVDKRGEIK